MKDKHTPGPWTINAHSNLISDKDGNILAYLRCTKTTSLGNGWLPMEANAKLMAASTELFEILDSLGEEYLMIAWACVPAEFAGKFKQCSEDWKVLKAKIEGDE